MTDKEQTAREMMEAFWAAETEELKADPDGTLDDLNTALTNCFRAEIQTHLILHEIQMVLSDNGVKLTTR